MIDNLTINTSLDGLWHVYLFGQEEPLSGPYRSETEARYALQGMCNEADSVYDLFQEGCR